MKPPAQEVSKRTPQPLTGDMSAAPPHGEAPARVKASADAESQVETEAKTKTAAETEAVAQRYARRAQTVAPGRYSLLQPDVWHTVQERQRALLRGFAAAGLTDLSPLRLLEVGCGGGENLLELLRMGLRPEHLQGLELLPERAAQARQRLPTATAIWQGDALQATVPDESQDLVLQATVFSSLLDDAFQQQLAQTMWRWLKPGGTVIWYDFTVNNPRNPDVRGVPMARLRALFPQARIRHHRITLAPPLARALCRVHPALYTVFNAMPLLRTHVLAWLHKPVQQGPAQTNNAR